MMTLSPTDLALCRSALYSALALGFDRPGKELGRVLLSREGARALAGLLADCALPQTRLPARLEQLAGTVPDLELYTGLFGHTARGALSPYETEYGGETLFQQPQELGDLAGFLAAFGLRMAEGQHERVDHVRCECELMAFLARKEAHAHETCDAAMLAETRKAERLFLRDHLGRFAPAFGERLHRADPDGFYGLLGELLRLFVEAECRREAIEPGPEGLGLRLGLADDGAPMLCGGADACQECPS
jgi:DMSO reductase family type II enzyme chaperone